MIAAVLHIPCMSLFFFFCFRGAVLSHLHLLRSIHRVLTWPESTLFTVFTIIHGRATMKKRERRFVTSKTEREQVLRNLSVRNQRLT